MAKPVRRPLPTAPPRRSTRPPSAADTLLALTDEIARRRSDLPFQSRLKASVRRNQEILRRLAQTAERQPGDRAEGAPVPGR
jgi:hypothetical protein